MLINDVNFISLKSLLGPSYQEGHQRIHEILSIRGYMSFNLNSSGWGTILRLGHVNNHSNLGFSPHATWHYAPQYIVSIRLSAWQEESHSHWSFHCLVESNLSIASLEVEPPAGVTIWTTNFRLLNKSGTLFLLCEFSLFNLLSELFKVRSVNWRLFILLLVH